MGFLQIIHQLKQIQQVKAPMRQIWLFKNIEIVPKHDFVGTVAEITDLLNR